MYPHSTHVFTNFDPWEPSWVQICSRTQGYHCVNIGKMHINPYDAAGGFHQRFFVENKDRPLFLEERTGPLRRMGQGPARAQAEKPSRSTAIAADPEGYTRALGAFTWHLDEDMHSGHFRRRIRCLVD